MQKEKQTPLYDIFHDGRNDEFLHAEQDLVATLSENNEILNLNSYYTMNSDREQADNYFRERYYLLDYI